MAILQPHPESQETQSEDGRLAKFPFSLTASLKTEVLTY